MATIFSHTATSDLSRAEKDITPGTLLAMPSCRIAAENTMAEAAIPMATNCKKVALVASVPPQPTKRWCRSKRVKIMVFGKGRRSHYLNELTLGHDLLLLLFAMLPADLTRSPGWRPSPYRCCSRLVLAPAEAFAHQ